jgi:peptidoglycan/LPS O-acetylase OafA/YrhL
LSRSNNFDAVRLLAASAVIYGHAHPLTETPDLVFLGNTVQSFAVKVFFIVSGFLVARSWAGDPHPLRYLAKRALRIFPGLLLLLLVTVLVLGPIMSTLSAGQYLREPGTRMYFLYNAMLYPVYSLPGVFSGNLYPSAVNGSLWSLPAEFLMYLVMPIVYVASRLVRSDKFFFAVTIALCALSLYYVRVSPLAQPIVVHGTGLASVLDCAPFFFLGAAFSIGRMQSLLNVGFALFMIGVLVFVQPQGALWSELALYLVAPYCVLSFATAATPGLKSVGKYGDPSYGIYLYGWPAQQIVCSLVPNVTAIGNTLAALPLAVIAAYLSWYAVEKRALAMKPWRKTTAPQQVTTEQ